MSFDAQDLALSSALEEAGDKARVGNFVSVEFDDDGFLLVYVVLGEIVVKFDDGFPVGMEWF